MNLDNKPLLYLITDRTWLNGRSLTEVVEDAIKGGVNVVQLRDKGRAESDIVKTALELKEVTRQYNVPLIINDSPRIAKLSGADGVHLGASDGNINEARAYLGESFIIGGSARTVDAARELVKAGVDYLGIGAVFGTTTKIDARTINTEILSAVAKSVDVPSVAIGGVNSDNVDKLAGSGVSGIAVVSAILNNSDIRGAAEILYRKLLKLKG